MKIEVKHFFDAQHQLPNTEWLVTKACHHYHGHTYKVEVFAESEDLRGGMVVDFKGIKNIIDSLDHTAIYEQGNPMIEFIQSLGTGQEVVVLSAPATSENIAKHLHSLIKQNYPFLNNIVVKVCEGYKGEEKANWTTYEE